ncbi:MAG TPA: histidine phosphatase family protein [Candidatus Ruminococcus avistercoris]|nr:histidine phosphatase family protein [Candidatus Ruminococcus avistercoris]
MKLYFIRHGETVWNTQAKLQGKSDIPLNEKGVALARVTGEALADVPFAAIYSSPLKRALQTAQLVAGDRDVPIVTDRRLEEIGFGIWEGLSCHKDHYEIPSDSFQDFFLDPFGYQPPAQGETVRHVCGRTADFLEELIRKMGKEESNVLISCHGCTLRALMNYFYQDYTAGFWRGHVPPNCSVSIVEVKEKGFSILAEDKIFYDKDRMGDYYGEGTK